MHFKKLIKYALAAAAVLSVASAAPQHDYAGTDDRHVSGSNSHPPTGDLHLPAGAGSAGVKDIHARDAGVSTSKSKALQKTILDGHNQPRARYHAPGLTWNATLASFAQAWVDRCQFAHSGGPYGENLYAVMPKPSNAWDAATQDALAAWMGEAQKYDYTNPGFSMSTGHFTQFVWKGTKEVGCAWNTAACQGMTIFMCDYSPPGNVGGQYQQNVLKP